MPQQDCLLPWYTALDNAGLALRNRGRSRSEARAEAGLLFERFGLSGFEGARPDQLSGGMRQRVAFLRTLVSRKDVLLLDEPFASLDAITRAELQEWLLPVLAEEDRTVVLVTHDVEEALYLSDTVLALTARPGRPAARIEAPATGGLPREHVVTGAGFGRRREELLGLLKRGSPSSGGVSGVRSAGHAARLWLPPLVLILFLLALWQLAAGTGFLADSLGLEDFLVPSPAQIAEVLWQDRSLIAENAEVTLVEILAGFAVALLLGLTVATALHFSELMRRASYPVVVASQTIPIIVIAPILVVWFGYGIGPKLAVIALICFFPITVNTLDGLRSVDPDSVRMMRTLYASRSQIFRRVEAPAALPYAFSGAKIAVAVAVIGAVFGEWAGSERGLGHLMLQDNAQLMTARLFASVAVLSLIAIVLFALIGLVERALLRWR